MNDVILYRQIYPNQCQALAQLGFKSLINLRFDDESDRQPTANEVGKSAKVAGMAYHHLPIDGDNLHLDSVQAFATLIKTTPKPVMVFCGTGNRAKRLYQSAVVSGLL